MSDHQLIEKNIEVCMPLATQDLHPPCLPPIVCLMRKQQRDDRPYMYRSFTDRVLGGVCGGLAALLPLSSGWVRALWLIIALVTLGAFAVLYLALWLLVPQQSPTQRQQGGAAWLMLLVLLTALVTALWLAQLNGLTQLADGRQLYFPLLALLLSIIFFVRQLGRA